MKVGDLVTHPDRKDFGIVTKIYRLRENIREISVHWHNGDFRIYQTDYYLKGADLEAVCK